MAGAGLVSRPQAGERHSTGFSPTLQTRSGEPQKKLRLLRNGNFHEMIRNMTPLNAANDGYLPARQVWERYRVSNMTLHRWLNDKDMGFPKPFFLGRFRYWRIDDLRRLRPASQLA